jgi:diguanylate cyclase (GGDEF)-like protein
MGSEQPWRPSLKRWSGFAVTWHLCVWGGLVLLLGALMQVVRDATLHPALVALVVLALVAELRPVVMPGNDTYGVVVSEAFTLAVLYMYGIGPALLTQAVVTVASEVMRRKPLWKLMFNVGQYSLSIAAIWPLMVLVGQTPSLAAPATSFSGDDLWWMAITWVVFYLVNTTLVAGVSADEGLTFTESFFEDFWYYVLTHFAVFVLSPVVALVALDAWQMLPLFLLPLFAVYKAAAISREKDHAATHDQLTSLPNRRLLIMRIQEALTAAQRDEQGAAVLLLDLNRFKEINDTLGHSVGDEVLQVTAERLLAAVRPQDTVCRLGGDEFAIVLPDLPDVLPAVDVAGRVRSSLREPMHVGEAVLDLDVSIGIAMYPQQAESTEDLLRRADVAMYLAKENGSHIEVYRADQEEVTAGRMSLLSALRRAIDHHDLVVHYQPVVDVATYRVVGMEALVRWNHPQRGLLSPAEFLPLAESSGLMHRLTQLVVADSVAQAARWREDGLAVPVAVNVSLRDLAGPTLIDTCRRALHEHALPGDLLQLEITERLLMAEPDAVGRTIDALADLGISLSLDDFGTGFASMVMLRRLPVARLKVDSSFVRRLHLGQDDHAIVASIIQLAHTLGMEVVAEGVETASVWDHLGALGCDAAQGWHIGRDMPADEATAWLRAQAATRIAPRPLRIVSDV